jgi:hypothetical protein
VKATIALIITEVIAKYLRLVFSKTTANISLIQCFGECQPTKFIVQKRTLG